MAVTIPSTFKALYEICTSAETVLSSFITILSVFTFISMFALDNILRFAFTLPLKR